jgi:8-oxo-dGTP diphosphatase
MANRKTRIVVRCIFKEEDKTLLMRRTKIKGDNFGFIGGHVDPGESPIKALIREIYEEIGVKVKVKHLSLVRVIYRGKGDIQKIHLVFEAKRWKGEPVNLEPRFCKYIGWYPLDDLPKKLSPTTVAMFQESDDLYFE